VNIVVCVKQVPDTETKIQLRADCSGIITEGIKYVMNPYDEYAVEEGIRLKEKFGGEVTIVCLGPDRATETIRTALAMGADKGIFLHDPFFEGSDSYCTARILAGAISQIPYDIILTGKQAVDEDNASVFAYLAEFLNLPYASVVVGLELAYDLKFASVKREGESGEKEIIQITLPAIIACQKDLNQPRYASLPGIMKAKKKEIKIITAKDLGFSPDEVGHEGSKVKISDYSLPPERKQGIIIQGEEPSEICEKLVKLLREEAKMI
jgi:electron transfer flavoprotein beta subunit